MMRRLFVGLLLVFILAGCSARHQAQTLTMPVNGVDIGYRVLGEGEPLLMVMGYAGTMDVWDPTLVEALAGQYKVILFDNRNMGYSSTSTEPVTMRLMADDALGLLDGLGIEKAHVLGWSMGSIIAQEMAFDHPGKVGKLVLYGTACESATVMEALRQFDGLTSAQFKAMLFPEQWAAQHPDVWSRLPSPSIPATPEAVARQKKAIADWSGCRDRLPSLKADVLVMVGEEDNITPVQRNADIAGLVPGAWLMRYKGAGHWLMYQDPEGMGADILRFLDGRQDLLDRD